MSAEEKREAGRKKAMSVELKKRSTVMKDGRNMYFYTFESPEEQEQPATTHGASAGESEK